VRIMIVGGTSSLAYALKPVLSSFAEVITADLNGCDVKLNLTSPMDEIGILDNIDVVINTAASFGGADISEIVQTESVNVLGVMKLCGACKTANVGRLVQISSIFACLDTASPFYTVYSLSKRHSEEAAQLCCSKLGLPLAVLRPAQFYGVGERYRKSQPFLFSMMDKAEKNEDIVIYGSNDAARNFIHVEDVAKIVALVAQQGIEGVYSCTNTANVTFSEMAAAAVRAFASKSTISFAKDKPDVPDNVFELDDTLFRLIGYYPQIDIAAGMAKEANYRRTHT